MDKVQKLLILISNVIIKIFCPQPVCRRHIVKAFRS